MSTWTRAWGTLGLALLCAWGAPQAHAQTPVQDKPSAALARVLVLRSAALRPYVGAAAGFRAELEGALQVDDLTLDEQTPRHAESLLAFAKAPGYRLVLALGPYVVNAARQLLPDVPLVFALVPFHERYGLDGPSVTGISLTRSLAADVRTLVRLVPGVKRVGVLFEPRSSGSLTTQARAELESSGLTLVTLPLPDPTRIAEVLQVAKGKVDGLVMVPDATVASAGVVRALLGFAQSQKVPLLGLSPSQVREGAFVGLSPDPVALGRQAAKLARRIVFEKVNPGALEVAEPEGLELCLNVATARKLAQSGVALDAVLAYAAEQNFTLRVFE